MEAVLSCEPVGHARWSLAVSNQAAPQGPGLDLTLTDPDGQTVGLWLDHDASDNLRSGLDLIVLLHQPSLLRTDGDRSQIGDYTLAVEETDRIAVSVTRDGLRLAVPFTRSEIRSLSAAISAGEAHLSTHPRLEVPR